MKFGPFHVLRDSTIRRLSAVHELWDGFVGKLATASSEGNALADRVYDHSHGLAHSPLGASVAPVLLPSESIPVLDADRDAAERVIAAYHRAKSEPAAPPSAAMWDRIEQEKAGFLTALEAGDRESVAGSLSRLFVSDLIWGLGNVHPDHPNLLRSPEPTHLHLLFTDSLVNLAESIGAARVTSFHQDPASHLNPLQRDLGELLGQIEARLGFDLGFPTVGGSFGFQLRDKLLTIDSLIHGYTAYRLRELAGIGGSIFEIGGGYGCLAMLAHRAGLGSYTIFDLPWVNVLQGYFLIRSLPEGRVRLYGETTGDIAVSPYWALDTQPNLSCDVLVNTDSLPEMGRATAAAYLPKIQRVTRKAFLSINQEAMAEVVGVGPQNCVRELVEEAGGFTLSTRHRAWMRQGYVEELFLPNRM